MIYYGLFFAALHFGLGIVGFDTVSDLSGLIAIGFIVKAIYNLILSEIRTS